MELTASMHRGSRWRGNVRVRPAPEPVGGHPNPAPVEPSDRTRWRGCGAGRLLHRRLGGRPTSWWLTMGSVRASSGISVRPRSRSGAGGLKRASATDAEGHEHGEREKWSGDAPPRRCARVATRRIETPVVGCSGCCPSNRALASPLPLRSRRHAQEVRRRVSGQGVWGFHPCTSARRWLAHRASAILRFESAIRRRARPMAWTRSRNAGTSFRAVASIHCSSPTPSAEP